jgi:hypothetical protein
MTDVTQILQQIESGDPSAAEELLPLVYGELRKLAAARLAHERPGQTLQATASTPSGSGRCYREFHPRRPRAGNICNCVPRCNRHICHRAKNRNT